MVWILDLLDGAQQSWISLYEDTGVWYAVQTEVFVTWEVISACQNSLMQMCCFKLSQTGPLVMASEAQATTETSYMKGSISCFSFI